VKEKELQLKKKTNHKFVINGFDYKSSTLPRKQNSEILKGLRLAADDVLEHQGSKKIAPISLRVVPDNLDHAIQLTQFVMLCDAPLDDVFDDHVSDKVEEDAVLDYEGNYNKSLDDGQNKMDAASMEKNFRRTTLINNPCFRSKMVKVFDTNYFYLPTRLLRLISGIYFAHIITSQTESQL